jgi:hypothetical protein
MFVELHTSVTVRLARETATLVRRGHAVKGVRFSWATREMMTWGYSRPWYLSTLPELMVGWRSSRRATCAA